MAGIRSYRHLALWKQIYGSLSCSADIESRKRDLMARFKKKGLSDEQAQARIEQLESADPSQKKSYLNWLVDVDVKEGISDVERAHDLLVLYDSGVRSGIIGKGEKLSDLKSLEQIVDNHTDDILAREDKLGRKFSLEDRLVEGAEVIYKDNPYVVIKVATPEASLDVCKTYGAASSWCVGNDFDWAEEYLEDGPIYLFFKGGVPYCALSGDGECSDRQNNDGNVKFNQEISAVAKAAGIPYEIDHLDPLETIEEEMNDKDYSEALINLKNFPSLDNFNGIAEKILYCGIKTGDHEIAKAAAELLGVDIKPFVEKAIEKYVAAEGDYQRAAYMAKEYGVDPKPYAEKAIERYVVYGDYRDAAYMAKEYGLDPKPFAEKAIERYVAEGDYAGARHMAEIFGLDPELYFKEPVQ